MCREISKRKRLLLKINFSAIWKSNIPIPKVKMDVRGWVYLVLNSYSKHKERICKRDFGKKTPTVFQVIRNMYQNFYGNKMFGIWSAIQHSAIEKKDNLIWNITWIQHNYVTINVQKSRVTYWLIPSNEASLETFPLSVLTPRWEEKEKNYYGSEPNTGI